MMQCMACGKKHREKSPQGVFTAYKSGMRGFVAHFHLCIDCCLRVKDLLNSIVIDQLNAVLEDGKKGAK